MPNTLVIRTKKRGSVYVSVQFLIQLLSVLYETLCFAAARRRLIVVYMAAFLSAMSPVTARNILELQQALVSFPNPIVLACIARRGFKGLVKRRVSPLRSSQFLYNL